ncbi:putative ferric reductase like transmembrane component [Rosellinia necatrix]|uniref:Putative ferric reductase like transmembrane component n=1 Tax=Rosellinia necatrix TaxID=77044 RepID=A0A1W2TXJ1_ROSNE|nr:putative ferric reductase like transmembrane component [Rosellinia necatrix]
MQIATAFSLLPLLSSLHHVGATKNGIVGFGIDIFPDLCCQACTDSLSSLYLSCTNFSDTNTTSSTSGGHGEEDMAGMPTTSDECRASNRPWLETMAYCVQQNCNAVGFEASKQASCFSLHAVAGAAEPTFQQCLPMKAPATDLTADAVWLNSTSLVNSDLYYSTYGTYAEFERSEIFHTTYSVTLILLVVGIILACGIANQLLTSSPGLQKQLQSSGLWSKLRQHLWLPALAGSRHLQPLPGHLGYIPSRMLSVNIGLYIILNIIFSSVSFRTFQPNIFFLSWQFEVCEYVGNRTGTLSLVNTAIAILFAGRNNLLINLTGWSQTTFLTLHRWSARVATAQAIVHSVIYTLAYWEPGYDGAAYYAAQAAMPFYWWGIIATIAYALATSFAILPLRAKAYDTFLLLHISLAILALVGCWYHLIPHFGFDYGYQVWLYLAFAFWSADRLARFVRLAYYNHFGSSKAIVEAVPGCDIFHITAFPRKWVFRPGQHTFLYIPWIGAGKFWENHPFSVAKWTHAEEDISLDRSSNELLPQTSDPQKTASSVKIPQASSLGPRNHKRASIQFLVRGHAGMTAALREHMSLYSHGSRMSLTVYSEGPYAGRRSTLRPFHIANTVLCIVGGIGITYALGFIQEFVNANSHRETESGSKSNVIGKAKRLILAWSAKEMALLEYVRQNFLKDCEEVEYLFFCTSDGFSATREAKITAGRMDVASVIRNSVELGHQTTVLACGPGGRADEVRQQVINCVRDGFNIDLVEEAFCW